MVTNNPATLAQIIGFGIFMWVGLYVLVRGTRRTPLIVVSLIGLFAQAIFFGTGALTDTQTDVRWFIALERWSLWTIVVPAATWFHLSSLVAQGEFSKTVLTNITLSSTSHFVLDPTTPPRQRRHYRAVETE